MTHLRISKSSRTAALLWYVMVYRYLPRVPAASWWEPTPLASGEDAWRFNAAGMRSRLPRFRTGLERRWGAKYQSQNRCRAGKWHKSVESWPIKRTGYSLLPSRTPRTAHAQCFTRYGTGLFLLLLSKRQIFRAGNKTQSSLRRRGGRSTERTLGFLFPVNTIWTDVQRGGRGEEIEAAAKDNVSSLLASPRLSPSLQPLNNLMLYSTAGDKADQTAESLAETEGRNVAARYSTPQR